MFVIVSNLYIPALIYSFNPTLTLMIDSNFISLHSFILIVHPYIFVIDSNLYIAALIYSINPTLTLMIDSNFISQHSFILLIHPYICDIF